MLKIEDVKYRRKIFWLLQLSAWFGFGIIDAYIKFPNNITEFKFILASLVTYITGIVVTSILRIYYRRINLSKRSIFLTFFYIILFSIPSAFIWIIFDLISSIPVWGFNYTMNFILRQSGLGLFFLFFFNTIIIIAWSGLYFGFKYMIEWTVQKEKIEKTELLLEIAQLKMLRYQLDPHFLFNSLSSLRMLIRKDPPRAEHMLNKIVDFLHHAIASKHHSEVPLSEELKIIDHYLEIEKIRFADKLEYRSKVDRLAEDFPIPIFLLYPLIENAVKYGMSASKEKLKIELNAEVEGNQLNLGIKNSGHWINPANPVKGNGNGVGLENVQKRLKYSYPDMHHFSIIKDADNVTVNIKIIHTPEDN